MYTFWTFFFTCILDSVAQEPSKKSADLIVHSTGDSLNVAICVLKNHVKACIHSDEM
jgi:hypothetical protein